MTLTADSLPRILTGGTFRTPEPDNTNWRLKPDWMTPAELIQEIGQWKQEMRDQLAADHLLLNDRKFRLDWDKLNAIERCAVFHLFGQRRPSGSAR